jgi:hypothetical protein
VPQGPDNGTGHRHRLLVGFAIKIRSQQLGEDITGNAVWNKIDHTWAPDCYVSDYYTKTAHKWVPGVSRC